MNKTDFIVSGINYYLYSNSNSDSKYILLQPIDEHDLEILNQEVELIEKAHDNFILVVFKVND